MNENSINTNIENENQEVKHAIYSSKLLMNRDLFCDFGSISYNKTKKLFLFSLLLVIYLTIVIIFSGSLFGFVFYFFTLLIMFLMYFNTKKSIKIGYERTLISAGKELLQNYELFEDKIVVYVDGVEKEYFYHQITKFFETKSLLLLHLQHNLYITVEKSSLNASVDEVKAFLIEKCTFVKNKKFVDCSNDQKLSLVLLIALTAVSVIGIIISLVSNWNYLF